MAGKKKKSSYPKELWFYFDYISPYSYLAWRKIKFICEDFNLVLKAEPILFGAVLSHWKTLGPAEIAPKREFVMKDILRSAHRDNMIVQFPPAHPFNPLLPLRATCAMQEHPEYHRFITHLYSACWQEGNDITNPEIIDRISRVYKVEDILERANSPEIKQMLKEKTDKALENNIFGVPSFRIGDELFWGNDRIDFLINYLNGDDPVDPDYIEKLKQLPIGITRNIPSPTV